MSLTRYGVRLLSVLLLSELKTPVYQGRLGGDSPVGLKGPSLLAPEGAGCPGRLGLDDDDVEEPMSPLYSFSSVRGFSLGMVAWW